MLASRAAEKILKKFLFSTLKEYARMEFFLVSKSRSKSKRIEFILVPVALII